MKPNSKRPRIAKNYAAKNNGGYSHDLAKLVFDKAEKGHGNKPSKTSIMKT